MEVSAEPAADTVFDIRSTSLPSPHILDAMPDPIWVIDRRDRIVIWNQAAERAYGLPSMHAVGQSALLFIPQWAVFEFARSCEAVHRHGVWIGELTTQNATGFIRLVEARIGGVRGSDGSLDLLVAQLMDIGDWRIQAEAAERVARWSCIRALAAAIGEDARLSEGAEIASRFARGPIPEVLATSQGSGELILVLCQRAITRELVKALLHGAGYQPIIAQDVIDAVRLTAQLRDRISAAAIDPHPATLDLSTEFRRFHPLLPIVELEDGLDPNRFLEAIAERVSDTILSEAGLLKP